MRELPLDFENLRIDGAILEAGWHGSMQRKTEGELKTVLL